jgi:hypothetical protein
MQFEPVTVYTSLVTLSPQPTLTYHSNLGALSPLSLVTSRGPNQQM